MSAVQLLSLPEVLTMTGLARRTCYRYRTAGTFPQPVRLPPTPFVAWRSDDIAAWLKAHPRAI